MFQQVRDVVRVIADADARFRPAKIAWVVGVFPERPSGKHFESSSDEAVYAIEFEDGEAIDIPESLRWGALFCTDRMTMERVHGNRSEDHYLD